MVWARVRSPLPSTIIGVEILCTCEMAVFAFLVLINVELGEDMPCMHGE